MTPPTDFEAAHRRHWKDAELLFEHDRLGNADHLYGFCAECGLKAVMEAMGMPVDSGGRPPREYREHVPKLWKLFEAYASSMGKGMYLEALPIEAPFSDWSTRDRYGSEGHAGREAVSRHRAAARGVGRMVRMAVVDKGR